VSRADSDRERRRDQAAHESDPVETAIREAAERSPDPRILAWVNRLLAGDPTEEEVRAQRGQRGTERENQEEN